MENHHREEASEGTSSRRSPEEESTYASGLTKREVTLPNGIPALCVRAEFDTPARDILKALGVKGQKALILLFGGSEDLEDDNPHSDDFNETNPHVEQLFLHGIADVAVKAGAIIVYGGTQNEMTGLICKAYTHWNLHPLTLSIVRRTKAVNKSVTLPAPNRTNPAKLDPNTARLVQVNCYAQGCETGKLFELLDVIAERIQVAAILINGGQSSRDKALLTLKREWPLVAIKGSGGLADIISNWNGGEVRFEDRVIKEISDTSYKKLIYRFPSTGSPAALRTCLQKLISRPPILANAWREWATYAQNAERQKKNFNRTQQAILILGVLATLLALSLQQFSAIAEIKPLSYLIIIMPIAISILVAVENRFRAGKTWLLSRAAAEEIKQEIYKFRVSFKPYRETSGKDSPETRLAKRVNRISLRLRSELRHTVFKPYDGEFPPHVKQDKDVLSMLTTDGYRNARLRESIAWYREKAKQLATEFKVFQFLIYLVGGVGTIIAALGQHLWVALTASLAVVFTAYLAYRSTEGMLLLYNRTATNLANVETWWASLTPQQKESTTCIDWLVNMTEETLKSERIAWTRYMENALDQLKEQQEEKPS